MKNTEKKIYLLDAMALIYRAYYALNKNPRINSKGQNTSAIFGFINTLLELIKKENPTHIGVAFDLQGPTFRHEEFAEYKANREKMPEDIASAIPYIKDILKAMQIPVLEKEGFEADDIIGTLAHKAEKEGFDVFMMTSDKDYGQLVTPHIFMYKPSYRSSGIEILGEEEVKAKFNIRYPKQVIDLLGLWGDASDNIPGVPGIGEKTAGILLQQFDTIEDMIENVDKIEKPGHRKKIETYAEQALLSKKLATIITNVPIDFDVENLTISDPNIEQVTKIFEKLEFKSLLKRMFQDNVPQQTSIGKKKQPKGQLDLFGAVVASSDVTFSELTDYKTLKDVEHNYILVDNQSDKDNLIQALSQASSFCFDVETSGLDVLTDRLIGIAFSMEKGKAYYLPLPKEADNIKEELASFSAIFSDENKEKIGHNLKFDIGFIERYGFTVNPPFFDTLLAHYLIEPERKHSMDYISEAYLDYSPISYESLVGKGKNQLQLWQIPIETLKDYACEDADVTFQLKEKLAPLLMINGMESLFNEVEIPLIKVLENMELNGVKLDTKAILDISNSLQKDILELEKRIYEDAGTEFNIGSPKQLGEVLFEKMKITDKPKRTKTKQYATGEEVLKKLSHKHEIIDKILEYRQLTKLKSTYVDALPELINLETGRIHTSYNQAVTATGRLSSTNPNLQNIPIRTERGRKIRKAFVPKDEQHVLLAADYSQIELRIMAALSKDEHLIAAFKQGLDIHSATAARIFGVPLEEVTSDMRRKAKTANFGIIYGISAFGLSERLSIPRKEAAQIISTYFEQYPAVELYMEACVENAKALGYVETLKKRRRYLPDINSRNAVVRGIAERNAINAPIQGSSADMIKIAMINIFKALKEKGLQSKMILQVHDELVFEVPKTEVEEVKALVKEEMENAISLAIPTLVDIKTGSNWLEAH